MGDQQHAALRRDMLEAARLGVRLRRACSRAKTQPAAPYFVYAIMLDGGRFYVGSTDNIYARLLDHELQGPKAAKWVRRHGPVRRVVEVMRNAPADGELYKTLEYMQLFGWQNVRGSSYCQLEMANPPAQLHSFQRRDLSHFEYLPRTEIDEVHATVRELVAEEHAEDAAATAADAAVPPAQADGAGEE